MLADRVPDANFIIANFCCMFALWLGSEPEIFWFSFNLSSLFRYISHSGTPTARYLRFSDQNIEIQMA
jgi:hypothetical protein